MKLLTNLIKIIFGFLSMLILTTGSVLACSCGESTPSRSFRDADVVFSGKVIEINRPDSSTLFKFEVEKSWKGVSTNEAVIASSNTDCDIGFKLNETYLVYARNSKGQLTTGICDGTVVMASANKQLEDLRDKTTIPITPLQRRSYNWIIYVIAALVLISILTVFTVIKGRNRAAR